MEETGVVEFAHRGLPSGRVSRGAVHGHLQLLGPYQRLTPSSPFSPAVPHACQKQRYQRYATDNRGDFEEAVGPGLRL